jgi:hypothetical protein
MSDFERASESVVDLDSRSTAAAPKAAAASPVAASEAQATEPAASETKDPNWLPARLERERRKLLSDLGVERVDDARAAIAELKKLRDAEKTETERMRAQIAELEGKAKRADYLDSVVSVKAKAELATLTDAQREAVMAVAGEDSGAQLKAVELLRPTWTVAAPAVALPTKTAPANTAPAAKSPAPSSAESENVLDTYKRLQSKDPQLASQFRLANLERYLDAIKARA